MKIIPEIKSFVERNNLNEHLNFIESTTSPLYDMYLSDLITEDEMKEINKILDSVSTKIQKNVKEFDLYMINKK